MTKISNKLKIILLILISILLLAPTVFASYDNVTMSIVDQSVCTIKLGETSTFEKKLVSYDLNNKTVTLQMQVTNNDISSKPTGEIVVVLDNSLSMQDEVSTGVTRAKLIKDSAKKLISNLLEGSTDLKIAIASFSTNTDVSKEKTLEDAQVVSELDTDATALGTKIDSIIDNGPRTDLQAGLQVGKSLFSSENNNKYMIVLTDGVPNVAINSTGTYYSDDVITKTNAELKSLANSGVNVITMLSGIADESTVAIEGTKDFGTIIKEVFGTEESPTAGTFHYIQDTNIETTITETIYNSLIPEAKTIKDITISDFFPDYIVNNFTFQYASAPTKGTISEGIGDDRSITWSIPELASGETATVQFTLKLNNNYASSIVAKDLSTNEKVDISFTDFDGSEKTESSTVTPKIRLAEPPAELPATGKTILIILVSIAAGLFIFSLTKLLIINNDMKQ